MNIKISNRVAYTFLSIIILILAGVCVYAFSWTTPDPGHSISEIATPMPCAANSFLSWDGTKWICADGSSQQTGQWIADANGIHFMDSVGVGAGSNSQYAVYGKLAGGATGALGSDSEGVYATYWENVAQLATRDYAVYGKNSNANIFGYIGSDEYGVYGKSNVRNGVRGDSSSEDYAGVYGTGNLYGVYGKSISSNNYGYLGGDTIAVYGKNSNGNYGYLGGSSYAGYFNGDVKSTGDIGASNINVIGNVEGSIIKGQIIQLTPSSDCGSCSSFNRGKLCYTQNDILWICLGGTNWEIIIQ